MSVGFLLMNAKIILRQEQGMKQRANWFCRVRGFSLIELLLVMVLLSVIASLSVPSFKGFFLNTEIQDSARKLSDLMRLAQVVSVSRVKKARILCQEDQQDENSVLCRIQIPKITGEDAVEFQTFFDDPLRPLPGETEQEWESLTGRWGVQQTIDMPLVFSPDGTQILFFPDGSMAPVTITGCRAQKCFKIFTTHKRGAVGVEFLSEE